MRTKFGRILAQMLGMACVGSATLACGSSDDEGEAKRNWQTLVSGEWTVPEGTEGYTCVRHTVQEDLYVNAFEAINPLGTHHTLLTMGGRAESGEPDGISKCNASTNGTLAVFASGVGTNPLVFPPGVALKIPAGTQLLLNLHLFNTGREGEISGLSGTRISTVPVEEVEHFAEGILAGPIGLNLPPGETTTSTGYCTMKQDTTLFAVAPHMHQLGTYERVFAETAGGEVTLFDAPYDFDEQSFTSLAEPLQLKAGDRLRVECTHQNTTTETVRFGESTLEEMCFAGVYRYPGDGKLFICFDLPTR
jgi:hypothetical protein